MKLLYVSDDYSDAVMGTKRSLREEVMRRGHEVRFVHHREKDQLDALVKRHRPEQVWLAHSGLTLEPDVRRMMRVPIVGFGFSDPWYFDASRLESYDIYVTNHRQTYERYKERIPCLYNRTACDLRFHKRLDVEKTIKVSFMGLGRYPHFADEERRIDIVNRLRADGIEVRTFGKCWPVDESNHGHVDGGEFLRIINESLIGLDIMDPEGPIGRRMVEYSACGVPVITNHRPEVLEFFVEDKELLTYNSYDELLEKLRHYLSNMNELRRIGERARKRCSEEHDIGHRVDAIFRFLDEQGVLAKSSLVVSC